MHKIIKTLLAIILIAQLFPAATCAHSIVFPETEKFVVDKSGRYIVPPTMCDTIRYVGCGLYLVRRRDAKQPEVLYDFSGKQVDFKLPSGCSLVDIVADFSKVDVFENPTSDAVIFFNTAWDGHEHKEGICDFNGRILIQPEVREFAPYLENGVVFAKSEKWSRLTIFKIDGQVLGQVSASEIYPYLLPQLGDDEHFSEGRCTVHRAPAMAQTGNDAALIDLSGKVFAQDKFSFINRFHDGKTIASSSTAGGAETSLIDSNFRKIRVFDKEIYPEYTNRSTCLTYYQNQPRPIRYGLMNANGKIIVKAKYEMAPFWYEKYFIGRLPNKQLDVFDRDGKLLWHGPQDINEPHGPLSPFQQFLLDREGVITRNDPSSPSNEFWHKGLYSKSGKWLIEPNYSILGFFPNLGISPPIDQYYFEKKNQP